MAFRIIYVCHHSRLRAKLQQEKFTSHSIKAHAIMNPFGRKSKLQLYKEIWEEKIAQCYPATPKCLLKFTKKKKMSGDCLGEVQRH